MFIDDPLALTITLNSENYVSGFKLYDISFDDKILPKLCMPHPSKIFDDLNKCAEIGKHKPVVVCFLAYIGAINCVAPTCPLCFKSFNFNQTRVVWVHYCSQQNRKHTEKCVFSGTIFENKCVTKIFVALVSLVKNSAQTFFKQVALDANICSKSVSRYFYDIISAVCGYGMSYVGTLGGGFTNPTEIDGLFEGKQFSVMTKTFVYNVGSLIVHAVL